MILSLLTGDTIISTDERPQFYLQVYSFKFAEETNILEFHLQIPYSQMQFIRFKENKQVYYQAIYQLQIQIQEEKSINRFEYNYQDTIRIESFMETVARELTRTIQYNLHVSFGIYKFKVILCDLETNSYSYADGIIFVSDYSKDESILSDLKFSVFAVGEPFEVWPNAVMVFSAENFTNLYLYFEVYNLFMNYTEFEVSYRFFRFGKEYQNLIKNYQKTARDMIVILPIRITEIPNGHYLVRVILKDSGRESIRQKEFVITGSDVPYFERDD